MRVMWWSDGGGVVFPSGAKVQYLDGEEWKDLSDVGVLHGGTNGANGVWNIVNFEAPVTTTALRLLVSRNATGSTGIGISEWEAYGAALPEYISELGINGPDRVEVGVTEKYTANVQPAKLTEGSIYKWSVTSGTDVVSINGEADADEISVKALKKGNATLHLEVIREGVAKEADLAIRVIENKVTNIDVYETTVAAGIAPILPDSVVANGVEFDDPTPSTTGRYDFGEEFSSRLIPVTWEAVNPEDYAAGKEGTSFTVKGTATYQGEEFEASAKITVKKPVTAEESNSSVTFENVQLEDDFWTHRQETNAITSLDKAMEEIAKDTGGEPNFDNAIKKLNGEPYSAFKGFVFQDSDIYKSIEAISYTLSATQNETSPEMAAQREKLEEKLNSWIEKIEKVQYADGYIDTHFTLRSQTYNGGSRAGTHRWREFANHEMYNAGHFLEGVVAYTRYREGIGKPDYRLYVAGRRFANEIVSLFGPNGTRHEVPGHEEIELALVKFGKLAEEYEGEGAGQVYYDTVQTLIDRRGENRSLRESNYKGDVYSQDRTPFKEETNAVGHAVRANYFYTGVTDIATLLPEGDEDRAAYINSLDTIWESVTTKKTYITGGIGATTASSSAEGFGADYDLPPNQSYCEICAAIAAANWNQRMNLLHEDGKYADMVEKNLYNSILVGENLDGNRFYYSTKLHVDGGNGRSPWFDCACCLPNLMRTIAALSGYMYTVHGSNVFVNMFSGSNGTVNVGGTSVSLKQETDYPWNGAVKMTVGLSGSKEFALKIRIPGWVNEQKNQDVTIKVNGSAVDVTAEKGYATLSRTWADGDVVEIDIPMEIRFTESDEHVKPTLGRIALQRGPIVYCMEKAGNAQLNQDIEGFDPLNFVIPRDAKLTATYNKDLLKGVVEITGNVKYATGNGKDMIDAKLQAVPYYAWNNRGDTAEYVPGQIKNNSTKMLIWTMADEPIVKEERVNDHATPSVNFVGWGMGAKNFADGDEGTFWNGHSDPNLQTQDQWMMYDFGTKKAELTEAKIWFYDDGGGVRLPRGITIEYETEDGTWAEVTPEGEWTYKAGEFVTYPFEKIITSKIRVTMNHALSGSNKVAVAVVEWELTGNLVVDKQALSALITSVEGLEETDYTGAGWKNLQTVLAAAKEILENGNATQEKVDGALADLQKAKNSLVSLKALREAIAKAQDIKEHEGQYVADNWDGFLEALDYAELKLKQAQDGKELSKAEIAAACTSLNTSMDALYKRADLSGIIEEAEQALNVGGYTTKSAEALRAAIQNAKDTAENSGSTAADLKAAEAELKKALKGLTPREDTSELEAKIRQAEALKESDYIADSWETLQESIKNAQDVCGDADSSASTIKAAGNAIDKAISRLVAKAGKSELNALDALIKSIEGLKAQNYTSNSWSGLQVAVAEAKAAHASMVKADVEKAQKSLSDAKAGLVDLSGLASAIANAEKLDSAAYSQATWAGLAKALADAKADAENPALTKDMADKAIRALEDAQKALKALADRKELERLIQEANALNNANYTTASWKVLAEALEAANQVSKELDETFQSTVDQAAARLKNAKDALMKRADRTELEKRIAEIHKLTDGKSEEEKYISGTWKALVSQLEEAEKALKDTEISQAQADNALESLNKAFSELLKRGDKTTLNKYIREAEELQQSDYTEASWTALAKALEAAKKVSAEKDVVQVEVNQASNALRDAKAALAIITYTVRIQIGNGAEDITETIVGGQLVTEPDEPVRVGYTFAGWFVGSQEFNFAAPVTADTVITAKWNALPSVSGARVKVAKAVYNGKARKPEVTVTLNGKELTETIDYIVTYSNNKKVGQGSVTIQGIDKYAGTKTVKFSILPAKVKISKIANRKGKKALVKFGKAVGAKGYQVTYSTDKSFKSAKNKNVSKNSITLTGLKKNKTYYVKVRAYTNINGKRVYGAYSTKVKVQIKK